MPLYGNLGTIIWRDCGISSCMLWQYTRASYNYYIFLSRTQLRKSAIVVSMLLRNKHLARVESFQNRNYPFAVQNACCKEVPYYFSKTCSNGKRMSLSFTLWKVNMKPKSESDLWNKKTDSFKLGQKGKSALQDQESELNGKWLPFQDDHFLYTPGSYSSMKGFFPYPILSLNTIRASPRHTLFCGVQGMIFWKPGKRQAVLLSLFESKSFSNSSRSAIFEQLGGLFLGSIFV